MWSEVIKSSQKTLSTHIRTIGIHDEAKKNIEEINGIDEEYD